MSLLQRAFSGAFGDIKGAITPSKTVTLETLPNNPEQEILRFGPNETDYFPVEGNSTDKAIMNFIKDENLSSEEKLRNVLTSILDACTENHRLFIVVLNHLLQIQKTGKNPADFVNRRIVRLRHLLSTIIIEGINRGEFKNLNVKAVNEMLYAFIESSIFRLAIFSQTEVKELYTSINLSIDGILAKK